MKKIYNWDKLPPLLDADIVAQILGVDDGTVRRLCRENQLPAKKLGKLWRIDRDKLRAQLGQAAPTKPPDDLPTDLVERIAQRTAEIIISRLYERKEIAS